MAELAKLTAISKGSLKNQQDMEALQRGANVNRAPAAVPTTEPALGEMQSIEDDVAKQQAANLANPGAKDKLNAVAKARAKFYGEGI